MALYVDSAYVEEVAPLCAAYPIAGVTTNPTILLAAKERGQALDAMQTLRELLRITSGSVFMQPTADTAAGLRDAAQDYLSVDSARVVLKLPLTLVGVEAGLALRHDGARIAFTAIASLAQAYLGMEAGAEWVIPYFGRLRRTGADACARVADMARLAGNGEGSTRLLAASLKSPADVIEVTLAGAHDVTVPAEVIRSMADDPLTTTALAQFAADWERFTQG